MYNPRLHFHFTGIGGTGMSGIAEILRRQGYRVSGSDLHLNAACQHLAAIGAVIREGHGADNLPEDCSLVVFSSAVRPDNVELAEAVRRGIPIVRRAEVLAELMRMKYGVAVGGAHGKTTTTSMVASVLEEGGLDPTVIIGGRVKAIGSGGKLGKGDFLVAESDESDRSFLLLKPTVAVVTNIDAEHLEAYGSMADLEESFRQFVESVPFYGLAVLCVDDQRVRNLAGLVSKRVCTYGYSPDADVRGVDLEVKRQGSSCTVLFKNDLLFELNLPLIGEHLLLNSLAAIAVGIEFDIPPAKIKRALESFEGVARRLEIIEEANGITVISDYAHHPAEIKASLRALRTAYADGMGRLIVVFQPHRYSRTRDCFEEYLDAFTAADKVVLTEIYPAGERPLEGVSGVRLAAALRHPSVQFIPSLDDLKPGFAATLKAGDVVVCMGAGSVGVFAESLGGALAQSRRLAAEAAA